MIPEKVICPPGEAYGSHELRTRGNTAWADITAWPGTKFYAIFTGGGETVIQVKGVRLWKQEMHVYMKERRNLVADAVDELSWVWRRAAACPRNDEMFDPPPRPDGTKRHRQVRSQVANDTNPHPEDFGPDASWWERWRAEGSRMSAIRKKQGESRCKVLYGEAPPPEETPQEYWIRAWSQQ